MTANAFASFTAHKGQLVAAAAALVAAVPVVLTGWWLVARRLRRRAYGTATPKAAP